MKRLLLPVAFALFILNSCQEEEQVVANNSVRFLLGIADSNPGDRAFDIAYPSDIEVEVLLSSSHESIIRKEKIKFSKTEDTYVSDLLDLHDGEYSITALHILNDQFETLQGLNGNFHVDKNDVKVIPLNNVRVKPSRPMQISAYALVDGKAELTAATAYISNDEGESYEYELSPKKNHIAFAGDPAGSYSIEVRKAGFEPYINTFVYNQLEKKRVEVTLQPKSTEPEIAVTFQPSATYFSMWMEFTGKGSVTLDWGNGNTEVISFDADPENTTGTAFAFRDQGYAISIPPAKITGDVHLLVSLLFEAAVDQLNTEYAPALSELNLTYGELSSLDLSLNNELTVLSISEATIGDLILPQQHAIRNLYITPSPFWPSAEQVDYIVSNVYVNTVAANITGGDVALNGAPVSPEAATMLNDLQNNYDWVIRY
jgi:hypothetical protein